MMNVYTRPTGWSTFVALVLFAGVLVLDVWLIGELPVLQHGLGYVMLQSAMVALLLKLLRLIFRDGSPPAKD